MNTFLSPLGDIQGLYMQFLGLFPLSLRPFVSIGLALLIIYSVIQIIRKDFVYLILLIVLLPASVPILKTIGQGIITAIKFLLNTK